MCPGWQNTSPCQPSTEEGAGGGRDLDSTQQSRLGEEPSVPRAHQRMISYGRLIFGVRGQQGCSRPPTSAP
jgi:hypothetical protein